MQINNIQPKQYKNKYNKNNKNPNFKGGRELIKIFANSDSKITTAAIEACVTSGRSANAYKRGGKHELRECLLDNVISAVFWMYGVTACNKIGDLIGEKCLKLPITDFDIGKDNLRDPFKHVEKTMRETASDMKSAKALTKKLSAFKYTKVFASTIIATGFVGFVLPKINHHITKTLFAKNKMNDVLNETPQTNADNKYAHLQTISFEDFDKNINKKQNPSFKGLISTVANRLENDTVCQLLTTDVGMLAGRVKNSRNKDEALEFAFRDSISPFFYYVNTPFMYWCLQKLTGSKGITSIDPVAAKRIHNEISQQLNGGTLSTQEFAKKTIGTLSENAQELFNNLTKNKNVISVSELAGKIDDGLLEKAVEMSKLQPELVGTGKVLTKQQLADVLKDGALNTPKFMQTIFKEKFGEDLTNPVKYISEEKITKFRTEIDDYVNHIIKVADKKNGKVIDQKFLDSMNRKGFLMSAGFRIFAMAASAFFLGIVIPKLQYAITAKRTGSSAAPGLREYSEDNNKKA